jgi:hypothetical protein
MTILWRVTVLARRTKLLAIRQQNATAALKQNQILHGGHRSRETGNLRRRRLRLGSAVGGRGHIGVGILRFGVAALLVGTLNGMTLSGK